MGQIDIYITYYTRQQLYIIESQVLFSMILINDKVFTFIDEMIYFHIKKKYLYPLSLVLVIFFVQAVVLFVTNLSIIILNQVLFGNAPLNLFLNYYTISCLELAAWIPIIVMINFIVKKSIIVIISLLTLSQLLISTYNVYISLPLSMRITSRMGYFYTFDKELWIGRLLWVVVGVLCMIFLSRRLSKGNTGLQNPKF